MGKPSFSSLHDLRDEFEQLKVSLSPEARTLFLMLLRMVEILIGKKTNSRNGHTAPSQDPYRPKRPKQKSKNKQGGQPGHKGTTLLLTPNPDEVILHKATQCSKCSSTLDRISVSQLSRHQIIDIVFKKVIIEHQVEHKLCSCGHHQCHFFGDSAPIQYGAGLKATAVELNQIQCISIDRTALFLQKKFDISLSPASVRNFTQLASQRLLIWEQSVKDELLEAAAIHADETGINLDGHNWWVHTLSTDKITLMIPHEKRGMEGMVAAEVLPHYHGILCHDFWSAYTQLDVIHVACHAHLQREFKKVSEDFGQAWAKRLAKLFLRANEERLLNEGGLSGERIGYYQQRFKTLLLAGERLNPIDSKRKGQRGKIGQTYPRRLINRLKKYQDWVLLFIYDPTIPFTNNQGERDLRMLKVQQKVSGSFRSVEGAQDQCRLRSYILTKQKQGISSHQAMIELLRGS